ncbi:2-aminoethanethiol dioxygenase [Ambystoma mexicanum]|uniref:2-aminoethanethiol dioxygenase n=1 Tax=Ambystoma mexicanum TaxID=8296 RepID=UPI0037E7F3BF
MRAKWRLLRWWAISVNGSVAGYGSGRVRYLMSAEPRTAHARGPTQRRRRRMPRDNMASLIQKIARQARLTFHNSSASAPAVGAKSFTDNLNQLKNLVNQLRTEDLQIAPRSAQSAVPQSPPVTYMHICETESFSMGVFLLQSGQACIPLHDHPGMHGMLKVLYGTLSIRGFDRLQESAGGCASPPPFSPPVLPFQRGSLRRALRRTASHFGPASPPCLLSPHRDNLHQISALDGPAAFLDILAPPYDSDDGRDCHYYQLLQPAAESQDQAGKEEENREVWLLEIPQPADFWCGGEPYPGPKVTL